ncbi:OmpW/AlkL family protein [Croceicoccus mobilis]|uniref:Outer membrane protein n=1 Tax=Croceicoccus mobilis TaxID=1703339 RepID=A0A916Z263_9SPHN|nr:OmpW family outer membrane protein [Croceicoccus mobilis]GGD73218.1 outer membrane protein [Croceicoccus mobilis]
MKKIALAGVAAIAAIAAPAVANAQEAGDVQVKLFATGVVPDGKIKSVDVDLVGLPAGTDTHANNNVVPTVAVEYFFTDFLSVETICCMTEHDVDVFSGPLKGAELVSDAKLIPATVTAKLHADLGGVKPYVGAGPTLFLWLNEKAGSTAKGLGVNGFKMSNDVGFALQAGFDIPIPDSKFGASVDVKRYFIDTTAKWYVDGTKVIQTVHELDPWVVSAGVTYRF